jgi:peptidoglycan/xylan/chitin deacetylase (PgdA/CDA1 family)
MKTWHNPVRCCCISIDVECDKGPDWLVKYPLQFKSVHDTIPNCLQPCFQSVGAKATYLLSPEVLDDAKSIATLAEIKQKGAELGTHLHGEFIPPFEEKNTERTSHILSHYPPEIEAQKIYNLTEKFKQIFQFTPNSFRAGRFGLSDKTLSILEKLNYSVDTSVAPFSSWKNEINFFGAPTQPYFPDQNNFDMRLVEIPVTIGASWWDYIPKFVLKIVPSDSLFWGVLRKHLHLERKFRPIWLRPTFATFDQMKKLEKRERMKKQDVFLNMMFHSVDFSAGHSPYAQDVMEVNVYKKRLISILSYLKSNGYQFITLSEAANIFRKKNENSTHYRIRTSGRC